MKKQLLLLTLSILLFTSLSQAQIKVWDFGGEQLVDGGGYTYTNMATSTSINAVCGQGASPGTQVSLLGTSAPSYGVGYYENDFGGGVKFVHKSVNSDRLRTNNPAIVDYDDNVGGNFAAVGVTGRIYVNSGGKGLERTLSITTTVPNQKVTILARAENMASNGGNIEHYLERTGGALLTFVLNASASDVNSSNIYEIHATLPVAGEYFYYDLVGKPSWYRVYFGDVNLPTIDASNAIGRATAGVNDAISKVSTNVHAIGNRVYVSNVKSSTDIKIYSITGALVKSFKTNSDMDFTFQSGLYIATVKTSEGQKSVKLLTK
ncbi:MAG: T9SS type A sorting domain-containing protein [Confluentibacter sp.]|nr:T9SS type A sorting domain-containing protein [Confluentibacter sp.]